MKARNSTLDIAKGLGILLVIFGHNDVVTGEKGELFKIIFSFHVPLFFFLSGVFLNEAGDAAAFIRSRADALLKPCFVVLAVFGALRTTVGLHPGETWDTVHIAYLLGMLYGTGSTIAVEPLWFLPHLFLVSVFSFFVLRSMRNTARVQVAAVAGALLVVGAVFIDHFWLRGPVKLGPGQLSRLPGLPWSLDLLPVTSAFLIAGRLSARRIATMDFQLPLFLVALAVFAGLHVQFDETIDFNRRLYGNFFVSSLQAAAGICLCLSLSALFARFESCRKTLAYIGSGTLFILIGHGFVQGQVTAALSPLLPSPWLVAPFAVGIAAALPLLAWEVVKRQRVLAALLLPLKFPPSASPANDRGK